MLTKLHIFNVTVRFYSSLFALTISIIPLSKSRVIIINESDVFCKKESHVYYPVNHIVHENTDTANKKLPSINQLGSSML